MHESNVIVTQMHWHYQKTTAQVRIQHHGKPQKPLQLSTQCSGTICSTKTGGQANWPRLQHKRETTVRKKPGELRKHVKKEEVILLFLFRSCTARTEDIVNKTVEVFTHRSSVSWQMCFSSQVASSVITLLKTVFRYVCKISYFI